MTTFEETIDDFFDIFIGEEFPYSPNYLDWVWSEALTDAVDIAQPGNEYYFRITRTVFEMAQWFTTTAQAVTWHPVIGDRIGLSVRLLKIYDSVTLTQAMTVSQSDSYFSYALRSLEEELELGENVGGALKYTAALAQALRLGFTQKASDHVSLSQAMTMADAAALYQYVQLIERLGIADTVLMPWRVYASMAEQLQIAESLARFLGGQLSDVVAIVESLARRKRMLPIVEQAVTVADTISRGLLLRIVANDTLEITHDDALKMLFKPSLTEALEIVSTYLDPEGITTWAVNLSHGGVTEYTNYNFNSFAKMGNKYLAASEDGLYELNGSDDAGDDIIAQMKSGMLQFGRSNYSSFKGIYLGARGGGDWVLKLVTGDGKSYTYSVEARTMETTKVNVGKGLRARYFSFELISTGQEFDLDSIEFIPIVAKRRV